MPLVGWRDPYIFEVGGSGRQWGMLMGSGLKGRGGAVMIYRSNSLLGGALFLTDTYAGSASIKSVCQTGQLHVASACTTAWGVHWNHLTRAPRNIPVPTEWTYAGMLCVAETTDTGAMWECPLLLELQALPDDVRPTGLGPRNASSLRSRSESYR